MTSLIEDTKTQVWEKYREAIEKHFPLELFLPICLVTQKRKESLDQGCVFFGGGTPPPKKVYFRMFGREQLIVKVGIQEKQCGFHPGHGTEDQIFSLSEMLMGS